ncbi:MAG: hypothetical protein HOP34_14310 [Methylococcaceae bacterium]|nr:hypothetical protein [Methylococcaceae bacterium]
MTVLLFSLRGVPEDEASEVRALLIQEAIDFYETSAGNWGMSMPALWLRDPSQLAHAQQLLKAYQQQRFVNAREQYLLAKASGQTPSAWQRFLETPLLYAAYLFALVMVAYVSVKFLFELGLTTK